MRRAVSVEVWGAAFMAMLGLTPLTACEDDEYSPNGDSEDLGLGDGRDNIETDSGDVGADMSANNGGNNGAVVPFPCEDPLPVLVDGQDSGYVRCAKGFFARPEVRECPSLLPRDQACDSGGGEDFSNCTTDADCTERPHGSCNQGGFEPGCFCNYGCTNDADCGEGRICLCANPVGQCVQAVDCTSDADCAGELRCTSYISEPGCGGTAFRCQAPEDECAADSDCPQGSQCSSDGQSHVCREMNCAIGRPFLVEGEFRLAEPVERADWSDRPMEPVQVWDEALRAHLCDTWTRIGLMEHASVAAFARFALQLLQLGAPPHLLELTHKALADETEHARQAFALASHYGGRAIGPGPLSMEGAMEEVDLHQILAMVIREGCLGETVAALEAAEALEHSRDPAVRAVLARIAEDERDHARLAWEMVRWALQQGDEALAAFVRHEFSLALSEVELVEQDDARWSTQVLLRHGVVSPSLRARLRQDAIASVLRPCLEAMLAAPLAA